MSDTTANKHSEKPRREAEGSNSSPGIIAQFVLTIHNVAQASVWSYIFFLTIQHIIIKKNLLVLENKQIMPLTMYIQALQVTDALFGTLGWTKTSVLQSILQSIGRNTIAWLVFPVAAPSIYPAICLLAWCPADIIRYLNYLNDTLRLNLPFLKELRYNAFLVLFPIGATGEFLANIYNYKGLKKFLDHKFDHNQIAEALYIWLLIYPYIVYPGMAFNYYTLLKSRAKFYRDKKRRRALAEADNTKKTD